MAKSGITIQVSMDNMLERIKHNLEDGHCNLASCRFNSNEGICQNPEKRKECVEVSLAVLCLDDKGDQDDYL